MQRLLQFDLSDLKKGSLSLFLKQLYDMNFATSQLQKRETTISTARDFFDGLIEEYPENSGRLSTYLDIVQDDDIGSAVKKKHSN